MNDFKPHEAMWNGEKVKVVRQHGPHYVIERTFKTKHGNPQTAMAKAHELKRTA